MNINDLRKIISEEVSKAVTKVFRSEIRDILVEVLEKQEFQDTQRIVKEEEVVPNKGLSAILQETKRGMSRDDYRNFLGDNNSIAFKPSTVLEEKKDHIPGMPDFLARAALQAKAVLDLSNQKDKEKNGL